jgi:hypothetical protein
LAAGWNAVRRCSWCREASSVRWGAFRPSGCFPKSGKTTWAWPARERGADARIGAGDRDRTGHERGKRPADEANEEGKTGKEKRREALKKEISPGVHGAIDNPHRRCSAWLGHWVTLSKLLSERIKILLPMPSDTADLRQTRNRCVNSGDAISLNAPLPSAKQRTN